MPDRTRILIISNGPLCRNPRVVKEAATLGSAGYDVTVLTVRNHAASEKDDLALLAGASFRRVTVDMLPGFETSGLAVFARRLRLWAARKLTAAIGHESIHSLGPAGTLLRKAQDLPAELTIVHNEIAHWVGTKLLKQGRTVAADIEDWHSEDLLPEARRQRPLKLIRDVERILLHQAVHTTTTSSALAAALHERYAGRGPAVITNSFPLQSNPRTESPSEKPSFFWFSQTIGPGRGLESFVTGWSKMRQSSRLVLLGESTRAFVQELRASVPADRQGDLEFLDLVPTAELPAVIAQHDIGLALELADIPNRDLTITNKILQYLNAGLTILATHTRGQQEVLAGEPDAGQFISLLDSETLAVVLDEFIADRNRLQTRQRAARRLAVNQYCWEQEAPKLLSLVAASVGPAQIKSFQP